MPNIHCASSGMKEVLSEMAPEYKNILESIPECLEGKFISFSVEEKQQGAISKFAESITKPIGEFASPVTKPVSEFISPVSKPVMKVTGIMTKPVSEAAGKMVKPMIAPAKSLAKKVGLGVVVSLVVISIIGWIKGGGK